MNFLPRVPGLVSGRVGFSPDSLVELSCCPRGNERFGPSGVFLLAHLCPGSKATLSSLGSSGLCYSSCMRFRSGGLCLRAWSWHLQHPDARSKEREVPPSPLTCQEPPGPEPTTPSEELSHPGPIATHGRVLSFIGN